MPSVVEPAALPNLFILGAAKAGTTSLYDLLRQHPDIRFSFDKEPMFFSRDDYFERGVDWYARTFFRECRGFQVRGEATPHYLYWAEKVAPRIKHVYGGQPVRFIVILREPVQRAYAWYWNMIKEGRESLPFMEALQAEGERMQKERQRLESSGSMQYGYYRGGRYAVQLRTYLDIFPREDFHILLLDDLRADPAGALKKICAFLEVRTDFEFTPVQSNAAAATRNQVLHRLIRGPSRGKDLFKRLIPLRVRHRLKSILLRLNQKDVDYPAIEAGAHRYLKERYAVEQPGLEALIGLDLSGWGEP